MGRRPVGKNDGIRAITNMYECIACKAESAFPLHPVELLRRRRVRPRLLSAHGQTHSMPLSNIASDHTLVCNVLPDLPAELGLDPEVPELVSAATGTVPHARRRPGGLDERAEGLLDLALWRGGW
jgi:hypothetical protein